MHSASILLVLAVAGAPVEGTPSSRGGDITLPMCLVQAIKDIQVPAEEAGQLLSVNVNEGDEVQKDGLVAQIDDEQAQMVQTVAFHEFQVAKHQAKSDVQIRFSQAANKVAEKDLEMAQDANRKVPGSITHAEILKRAFELRRTELQIEKSEDDQVVATLTAGAKQAEMDAARKKVDRHKILAPLDGKVVKILRREGEWVNPGDPVVQVVQFDTLRVNGPLKVVVYERPERDRAQRPGAGVNDPPKVHAYEPWQVENRPVTVRVKLADRDQPEEFTGEVTFANPVIEGGREFRVWATVKNRKEGDKWLLQPGRLVEMTIHMGP